MSNLELRLREINKKTDAIGYKVFGKKSTKKQDN